MQVHDKLVSFSRVVLGGALAFYKNRLLARLEAQEKKVASASNATDAAAAALNLLEGRERDLRGDLRRLKQTTLAELKQAGF